MGGLGAGCAVKAAGHTVYGLSQVEVTSSRRPTWPDTGFTSIFAAVQDELQATWGTQSAPKLGCNALQPRPGSSESPMSPTYKTSTGTGSRELGPVTLRSGASTTKGKEGQGQATVSGRPEPPQVCDRDQQHGVWERLVPCSSGVQPRASLRHPLCLLCMTSSRESKQRSQAGADLAQPLSRPGTTASR